MTVLFVQHFSTSATQAGTFSIIIYHIIQLPDLTRDTPTPCSSLSHMIPGLGGVIVSAAFGASFLKL